MKKLLKSAFFILLVLLMVTESHAQRGRGSFGGGEGGGGGRRGGGEAGGGPGGGGRRGADSGGPGGGRGGDTGGGGRPSRGGATGGGPTATSRAGAAASRSRGGDAGGAGGGRTGGIDMSAMAARFDSNKDGKLEPSEIQRIPEFLSGRLAQDGVDLNRTISTTDLGKMMSSSIQRMREQRTGESADRGRGGDERRGDERTKDGRSAQPALPTLFKMPERIKVIKTLSSELAEADLDQDGMVALYEWSEAGMDFLAFYKKDRNEDGFVTAEEEIGDVVADISRFKSERLTIVSATSTASNASSKLSFSDKPGSGMAASQYSKPEDTEKAREMFKGLDKDKDGKLSSEEWDRSGKIKSWFQSSKIELTAMNSSDFARAYSQAIGKYRKDRESKDGGRRR